MNTTPLPPGTPAPDFTIPSGPDATLTLSSLRGKPVVLAFYPADFSPVCGEQMLVYSEVLPQFAPYGAQVIGISVDGVWCHRAFAEAQKIDFPLLSDFEPKGAVARLYNVYREADGITERALFVLDKDGVICWSETVFIGDNPGAEGILAALKGLEG